MSSMKDLRTGGATPNINTRIAGRVRALRADLGMTLDVLAAKSEVRSHAKYQ